MEAYEIDKNARYCKHVNFIRVVHRDARGPPKIKIYQDSALTILKDNKAAGLLSQLARSHQN